jgi:hypothetical protein
MEKFTFNITIEAKSQNEANDKMIAISILASKLSEKELTKMAHIIKYDPVKTAMAKKYLGV